MTTDRTPEADAGSFDAVTAARETWKRTDAFINRSRVLAEELSAFASAVDWNAHATESSIIDSLSDSQRTKWARVEAALDRLRTEDSTPRETMAFLTARPDDSAAAPLTDFTEGRTIDTTVHSLIDGLRSYIDGASWTDAGVPTALAAIPVAEAPVTQAAAFFDHAAAAALTHRDRQRKRVKRAIAAATDGTGDPLTTIENQPIALFPIRLETRFVTATDAPSVDGDELWIRVFHDDLHVDTHEFELTRDERRWGKRFWARLWLAAHPAPDTVDFEADSKYLTDRIPGAQLRDVIASVDLDEFSSDHRARYEELKSRAWGQLVDRVGETRAGYVVHAMTPTDGNRRLGHALCTPPPHPELTNTEIADRMPWEDIDSSEIDASGIDPMAADGTERTDDASPAGSDESGYVDNASLVDADDKLPPLKFPDTPRRTASWTKQPIARLLPDRWIAVLEWEDADGESHRTAIAGSPIEDPLPVGPRAELENEHAEPPGTAWITDIEEAFDVGMALRVPLADLPGYADERGIDRLLVVGAKASMAPSETATALTDLLASHEYTTGLSLVSPGTPTNVDGEPPTGSMDEDPVAISPPRVTEMDLSDGDLLARALALDSNDRHPFANVDGAGSTDQLDARHANSALWPATIGYSLAHLLLPNEYLGYESIWEPAQHTGLNATTASSPGEHVNRPPLHEDVTQPIDGNDRSMGSTTPSGGLTGLDDPETALAWLAAYRRHFIRYVRARGPFPTLRIGTQPYGVLPVTATTDPATAVQVTDPSITDAIHNDELTVQDAQAMGIQPEALAASLDHPVASLSDDPEPRKTTIPPTVTTQTRAEPVGRAERDLYSYSFDPATSRVLQAPTADSPVHVPPGTINEEVPVPRRPALDNAIATHIESFVTSLRPVWSDAAANLSFATGQDDHSILDALQREAVSSSARVDARIYPEYQPEHSHALETFLHDRELTQLDPRLANLLLQQIEGGPVIEPPSTVDADIDVFVEILRHESIDDLRKLAFEIDLDDITIDPSEATGTAASLLDRWNHLATNEKRSALFAAIDAADSPREFVRTEIQSTDAATTQKLNVTASLAADPTYNETGVLRSLARILLHHAKLREYIDARFRLGVAFDDLPSAGPDFAAVGGPSITTLELPFNDLLSPGIPDALYETVYESRTTDTEPVEHSGSTIGMDHATRPAVNTTNVPSAGKHDPGIPIPDPPAPSYEDVLDRIAADDATTTGLDPRLSEFHDSLTYLGTLQPPALATLIGETLDLASHRLDAWWTSLATKRLFELREQQRVGSAAFDAWDVDPTDEDAIRATVDPSLFGTLLSETPDATATQDSGHAPADTEEPADAGIYVGGYGIVNNLAPTADDTPAYIHAPSEQQATTAALLRSGYLAGETETDDSDNILEIDLSPTRVQDAKWLLDGVRRGQSLGELLGYRFERHLHEATMAGADLLQYRRPLREEFPAVSGALEPTADAAEPGETEDAKSDVLNGYKLIRNWDDYDAFKHQDDLPARTSDAYHRLDEIVAELADDVDAVSDLLIAESIHQLSQRNLDRAGLSLEALATGTQLPSPTVTEIPRSSTGLTHRQVVLLEPQTSAGPDAHLRAVAEPSLEAWLDSLLPPPASVGCTVTYRWQVPPDQAPPDGETTGEATTTVTMDCLDLARLDLLAVAQDAERQGHSELERRFAYHLLRHRPEEVPANATLDLAFTDPGDASTSVAAIIEVARALASLIGHGRPVDGDDLTHPATPAEPGYDDATLDTITDRADAVHEALEELQASLVDRIAVLGVDTDRLLDPDAPDDAQALVDESASLPAQAETLVDAIEPLDESGWLDRANRTVAALAGADVTAGFEALVHELPCGILNEEQANADQVVKAASDQVIRGRIRAGTNPMDGGDTGSGIDSPGGSTDSTSSTATDEDESFLDGLGTPSWLPFGGDDEPAIERLGPDHGDREIQTEGIDAATPGNAEGPPDAIDEVTVYVWGLSGVVPFTNQTTGPVTDGEFTASVDFDDVEPGSHFTVLARAAGSIVYTGTGRVVADNLTIERDPASVIDEYRDSLGALCWLAARHPSIGRGNTGVLGGLDAALDAIEVDKVTMLLDAFDEASPVLTGNDRAALETLIALEAVDLDTAIDGLHDLVRVGMSLGFLEAFDIAGHDHGYDNARITFRGASDEVADVRRRLHRVVEDASALAAGVPARSLAFDHRVAHMLRSLPDPGVGARTLDALVHAPPQTVLSIANAFDRPGEALARITTWVFDPAAIDTTERTDLIADLRALAEAGTNLSQLFDGVASDAPTAAACDALDVLADALETDPNAAVPERDATDVVTATAATVASTLETDHPLLTEIQAAGVPMAVRRVILERLREPLLTASYAAVSNAVPAEPVGASPATARTIRAQAIAVVQELNARLTTAAALEMIDDQPFPQRLETERDRLEGLFAEDVTVFPPFAPPNGAVLSKTFAETRPPDAAGPLAVETWFQRVARLRDRPGLLRDALSYAEALSGDVHRSLTVGQLPFDPDERWMGADGVQPEPGRVSLVAQLGSGMDPIDTGGRMIGVFVDEWVESVPSATEDTGLAIQCSDPGSRPPQSILLAVPPEDEPWSLGALVGAVSETVAYASLRAVDLDDLGAVDGARSLFPSLWFPNDAQPRPRTPSVNFAMVDWYDYAPVVELLPRYTFEPAPGASKKFPVTDFDLGGSE